MCVTVWVLRYKNKKNGDRGTIVFTATLKKNLNVLLLFLTFSALVANPKKTTSHGGQSRSWSAEQGKKEKEKVWQRTPPPPRAARSEKIKIKKNRKSRGASTCLSRVDRGRSLSTGRMLRRSRCVQIFLNSKISPSSDSPSMFIFEGW